MNKQLIMAGVNFVKNNATLMKGLTAGAAAISAPFVFGSCAEDNVEEIYSRPTESTSIPLPSNDPDKWEEFNAVVDSLKNDFKVKADSLNQDTEQHIGKDDYEAKREENDSIINDLCNKLREAIDNLFRTFFC